MTLHLYPDLVQGSGEWLKARCGIVTASVVGKLITADAPLPHAFPCPECGATKGNPCISKSRTASPTPIKTMHSGRFEAAANSGETVLNVATSDTARGVMLNLVAERITGHVEDMPMSSAMWRGVEEEPLAREAYCQHHDIAVEFGFMVREDQYGNRLGYSPDGLVGDDGLIEIKSRAQKAQVATILADEVPAENMAQLQAGLLVSGRKWIDYVSYSSGMPLWVKRIEPDRQWFAAIRAALASHEDVAAHVIRSYEAKVAGLPVMERTPTYSDDLKVS